MADGDTTPSPPPPPTISGGAANAAAQGQSESGDWTCPDCANVNFAWRSACNRCSKERERVSQRRKKLGQEIGKAAAEKSRGLFSADDWQCSKCGNVNWARRQQCNVCNAPKFGDVEERTGLGGGYDDRGVVEYKEHCDSDDEYDEFGRRKRRRNRSDNEDELEEPEKKAKSPEPAIRAPVIAEEADEEEEDEDEDEEDDGDLSKYDLSDWGVDAPTNNIKGRSRSRSPIEKKRL